MSQYGIHCRIGHFWCRQRKQVTWLQNLILYLKDGNTHRWSSLLHATLFHLPIPTDNAQRKFVDQQLVCDIDSGHILQHSLICSMHVLFIFQLFTLLCLYISQIALTPGFILCTFSLIVQINPSDYITYPLGNADCLSPSPFDLHIPPNLLCNLILIFFWLFQFWEAVQPETLNVSLSTDDAWSAEYLSIYFILKHLQIFFFPWVIQCPYPPNYSDSFSCPIIAYSYALCSIAAVS